MRRSDTSGREVGSFKAGRRAPAGSPPAPYVGHGGPTLPPSAGVPAAGGVPAAAGLAGPLAALTAHLDALLCTMRQLVSLADEKLGAVRRADSRALDECAEREGELVKEALSLQQQRPAVLARVAQALPGGAGPPDTLDDLSGRLPEPPASSLRARRAALGVVADELQRKNRVFAEVARNLQAYVRGIFADVAKAAQENLVYAANGQSPARSTQCWVDAVG